MSEIECPYCGCGQDVDHDDGQGYEESVPHEMECGECEKNFVFHTGILFVYTPTRADCLNGSAHILRGRRSRQWPDWVSCKDCGYEKRGDFNKDFLL